MVTEGCAVRIQKAFRALWSLRDTASGRARVSSTFHTCSPLSSQDIIPFIGFLQQQLFVLAELDYPTPSHFLGNDLPPHPVAVACPHPPMRMAYLKSRSL